ncbi:alpha/beta-hydrolase [Myriangium duriaei CBS 260.36]|uniref:Alpha/beta-hydrolase n=1 Tax=Myriangium duriaei CBS 260.36 TaxID=1168546 RepID=A0A9P4JAB2_9PEZI|nr:alpha/beta-hydrolase [Myriangium duriaei CBS 260.36]
MSSQKLPTVVVVHGAWSPPILYAKLAKALQHVGFVVRTPALPTCNGARPPNSSYSQDVTTVRSILDDLIEHDGQEVVLLMHSYGGLVGSQAAEGLSRKVRAAKGLKGGITAAIYMCAYMCRDKSVRDLIEASGFEPLLPERIPHNDDGTCTINNAEELLYGDLAEEDKAGAMVSTAIFNGEAFFGRNNYAAWSDIHSVYIRTTKDFVVPEAFQNMFIDDAKADDGIIHVEVMETGHSPHIKDPQSVTKIVLSAVDASRV